MLKDIASFYAMCQKAIADSRLDAKLTCARIKTALASAFQKVVITEYVDPKAPTEEITKSY